MRRASQPAGPPGARPPLDRRQFLYGAVGLGLLSPAMLSARGRPVEAAAAGGTLTVAIGTDADTFDPAAQSTLIVEQMLSMVAETLVGLDSGGNPTPLLATSWQPASDGLSYTFKLRQGVKFQDGTPFNADAVKFSVERVISPTTFKALGLIVGAALSGVTVLDTYTVRIDLKQPYGAIVQGLSEPRWAITSPAAASVAPNTPARIQRPVGTGPYAFGTWTPGEQITFSRNPNYWGTKAGYAKQAYVVSPQAATRESLVRAGQAQVAMSPPPNDVASLKRQSGLKVITGDTGRLIYIDLNVQSPRAPQLANPKVRQALNYAVNKEALIKHVVFGLAHPNNSPLPPQIPGYKVTGSYSYDPSKAKQLLSAAGASNMSVILGGPAGRYIADTDVTQAVAGDLRAVGLNVTVPDPTDYPTFVADIEKPPAQSPFDMYLIGQLATYPDAGFFLNNRLLPSASNLNYGYDNPTLNTLLNQASQETNSAQRIADYHQAIQLVWDDAPWIFLYRQELPILTTSAVANIPVLQNEMFVTTWARPSGAKQ